MEFNQIKICRTTLRILRYSLIWPDEDEELNPGKRYYIRVLLFIVITSMWVASVFMHLVMSLRSDLGTHLSEDCGFIIAFCGIYYMTFIYVKNQPKIALLLRDLSSFATFGKPPGFEQIENKLSFWSKFCFSYAVAGIVVYNSIRLLQKSDCERINREEGLNENCGLLSPTWFPFKIDYFPVFHLVFLYIFVSTQILMKLALMISFNALEMIHHIILRIDHLNIMIGQCFEDENYQVSRNKLKTCILYHLDILDLSTRLDDCFSNCMFAHVFITAAICGCLEKQFVDGDNRIGALIHVLGWIMLLFLASLGGQQLIDAGVSISESIWASQWYNADLRLKKDLLFMYRKSQTGFRLTAGSFSVLSFSLFLSVLKMSYSILTMLTS
ncbi:odorant receptor 4-like [Tenebrio molitor]|uniref:odorant receptor 4-like n=1 Tax=Tenebrio molitor TaxID=7067 RepID=UPI0036249587